MAQQYEFVRHYKQLPLELFLMKELNYRDYYCACLSYRLENRQMSYPLWLFYVKA